MRFTTGCVQAGKLVGTELLRRYLLKSLLYSGGG
jgi:hypothetical protein